MGLLIDKDPRFGSTHLGLPKGPPIWVYPFLTFTTAFVVFQHFRRFAAILLFKFFSPLRGDVPCKKCFFNCCDRNISQSCTNDRNNTQSARSAIYFFSFSTLFFEICYYFRHRFVLQHSSNACTIIQLGQKPPDSGEKPYISWENTWIFFSELREYMEKSM